MSDKELVFREILVSIDGRSICLLTADLKSHCITTVKRGMSLKKIIIEVTVMCHFGLVL